MIRLGAWLAAALLVLAVPPAEAAGRRGPLNLVGRYLGLGWGDGYHVGSRAHHSPFLYGTAPGPVRNWQVPARQPTSAPRADASPTPAPPAEQAPRFDAPPAAPLDRPSNDVDSVDDAPILPELFDDLPPPARDEPEQTHELPAPRATTTSYRRSSRVDLGTPQTDVGQTAEGFWPTDF